MYGVVNLKRWLQTAAAAVLAVGAIGVFGALLTVFAADGGVQVPVIMYHAVIDDSRRLGQYVVSPAELESDFAWLQRNGYTAVLSEDLIRYVEDGTPLPEKAGAHHVRRRLLQQLSVRLPRGPAVRHEVRALADREVHGPVHGGAERKPVLRALHVGDAARDAGFRHCRNRQPTRTICTAPTVPGSARGGWPRSRWRTTARC